MTVGTSLGATLFLSEYAATISATCSFISEPCLMKADAIDFKRYAPKRGRTNRSMNEDCS
jgi:hypothetical protein